MKISVFGATAMAGTVIVAEALARGHSVTAWSRRLGTFPVMNDSFPEKAECPFEDPHAGSDGMKI